MLFGINIIVFSKTWYILLGETSVTLDVLNDIYINLMFIWITIVE